MHDSNDRTCTTISQKVIMEEAIALSCDSNVGASPSRSDRYPSSHRIVMVEIDKIVS